MEWHCFSWPRIFYFPTNMDLEWWCFNENNDQDRSGFNVYEAYSPYNSNNSWWDDECTKSYKECKNIEDEHDKRYEELLSSLTHCDDAGKCKYCQKHKPKECPCNRMLIRRDVSYNRLRLERQQKIKEFQRVWKSKKPSDDDRSVKEVWCIISCKHYISCRPVGLPCGHWFCRTCMLRYIYYHDNDGTPPKLYSDDVSKVCPLGHCAAEFRHSDCIAHKGPRITLENLASQVTRRHLIMKMEYNNNQRRQPPVDPPPGITFESMDIDSVFNYNESNYSDDSSDDDEDEYADLCVDRNSLNDLIAQLPLPTAMKNNMKECRDILPIGANNWDETG